MRMVRNLVTALAILASATAANAGSFVWYTATNGNAQSGGLPGAQGSALNLTCDTSGAAGQCSWVITMNLNTGTGGIVEMNTDLSTAVGNGVAVSNPALVGGQPFTTGASAGVAGPAPVVLFSTHGTAVVAGGLPALQTNQLITFTLTRAYNTGDLSLAGIRAGASSNDQFVWANNSGDYESVVFGSNPIVSAEPGTTGALPVINIQNVPEPTSIGLLALGALAIVRRRVAR